MGISRGKMLVSTKSSRTHAETYYLVLGIIAVLAGIVIIPFAFRNESMFRVIAGEIFGSRNLEWLVQILYFGLFFILPGIDIFFSLFKCESYCNVHENGVVGTTVLGVSKRPIDFNIGYDEILNVTDSGQSLLIYAQYATFEVRAIKNRTEALQEIKERITVKK